MSNEGWTKECFGGDGGRHTALPTDSQARKEIPIVTGLMDYFPNALAEVAHVSFVGNEKHNPGQPLHWSRDKSADHADCIARHLLERGTFDPVTKVRHSAQLAWRALALLQIEIEADHAKGAKIINDFTDKIDKDRNTA